MRGDGGGRSQTTKQRPRHIRLPTLGRGRCQMAVCAGACNNRLAVLASATGIRAPPCRSQTQCRLMFSCSLKFHAGGLFSSAGNRDQLRRFTRLVTWSALLIQSRTIMSDEHKDKKAKTEDKYQLLCTLFIAMEYRIADSAHADRGITDWQGIPGRGEPIRLAFEEAGVSYGDSGNFTKLLTRNATKSGAAKLKHATHFAPPILRHGEVEISQLPNIMFYLGSKLGLAPEDEQGKFSVNQYFLTLAE